VSLRWLSDQDLAELLVGDTQVKARWIVENLTAIGSSLAVSESLTGGLLSDAFVQVPGASAVYRGSIVAYATEMKSKLLGVSVGLLAQRGAVDPEVASAMAIGTKRAYECQWSLATTGVAGPTEQDGQPVGRVFIGVGTPAQCEVYGMTIPTVDSLESTAGGHQLSQREAVRRVTVQVAVALLHRTLQENINDET